MDVTIEAVVERPRAEVAPYVMDHENDTAWIGGISESELLGDPPLRVGSQVRRVAHFLGRRIDYVLRIERLDEGSFLGMRSVKAPFPMSVDYSFEDRGESTLVRVRVTGEPGRMYRLAGSMLASRTRSSIAEDLERLRAILEI
jgi:carbon monoxide dehydrogenase subunit G